MIVGVDYDTYKATFCAVPLDGSIRKATVATAHFRPASRSGEDAMLTALHEVGQGVLYGLKESGCMIGEESPVDVVWIERGFGMSRRADFALGCYFGAIYAACANLGVIVNSLEAREWKRTVTKAAGIGLTKKGDGNANAPKDVANEACRALLALGEVDGTSWTPDELDAFGVAFTGRRLNLEAVRV